jgi:hypothetical protein
MLLFLWATAWRWRAGPRTLPLSERGTRTLRPCGVFWGDPLGVDVKRSMGSAHQGAGHAACRVGWNVAEAQGEEQHGDGSSLRTAREADQQDVVRCCPHACSCGCRQWPDHPHSHPLPLGHGPQCLTHPIHYQCTSHGPPLQVQPLPLATPCLHPHPTST